MSSLELLKQRNSELERLIEIKELKIVVKELEERNKKLEELCEEMGRRLRKKTEEGRKLATELVRMRVQRGREGKGREEGNGNGRVMSEKEIWEVVEEVERRNRSRFERQKNSFKHLNKPALKMHKTPPANINIKINYYQSPNAPLPHHLHSHCSKNPFDEQELTRDDILRMQGLPTSVLSKIEKRCQKYLKGKQKEQEELKEVLMKFIGKIGGGEESLIESSERMFMEVEGYLRGRAEREEKGWRLVREFLEKGWDVMFQGDENPTTEDKNETKYQDKLRDTSFNSTNRQDNDPQHQHQQ